jgi:hypothetical protein
LNDAAVCAQVMFPSNWGMYDLNPDPQNAGAHMIVENPPQGRQMIFSDMGIAKQVGLQVYQLAWVAPCNQSCNAASSTRVVPAWIGQLMMRPICMGM